MLAALAGRETVAAPVALVVAHPDDETLAAGGSLRLFERLLLVHVTDGAPRRLGDAAREGFDSPAAYAAARAAELDAALALSGAAPERVTLGIPDQDATAAVGEITARLRALFAARGIRTVLTHAYEGGHPDHDAVALAAARTGAEIVEFAGYHADADGTLATGAFLPLPLAGEGRGEGRPSGTALTPTLSRRERGSEAETAVRLEGDDLRRKQAMLACFRTQREILSHFDAATERFRPAPPYDFGKPPHRGRLLYEAWGWMTGAGWREQVRCAA